MSWGGGSDIFRAVARKAIELEVPDEVKTALCSALIGALGDRGWDAADGLGIIDEPWCDAAFAEHGIWHLCGREYESPFGGGEWWQCERARHHQGLCGDDEGHVAHRDDDGGTWPLT